MQRRPTLQHGDQDFVGPVVGFPTDGKRALEGPAGAGQVAQAHRGVRQVNQRHSELGGQVPRPGVCSGSFAVTSSPAVQAQRVVREANIPLHGCDAALMAGCRRHIERKPLIAEACSPFGSGDGDVVKGCGLGLAVARSPRMVQRLQRDPVRFAGRTRKALRARQPGKGPGQQSRIVRLARQCDGGLTAGNRLRSTRLVRIRVAQGIQAERLSPTVPELAATSQSFLRSRHPLVHSAGEDCGRFDATESRDDPIRLAQAVSKGHHGPQVAQLGRAVALRTVALGTGIPQVQLRAAAVSSAGCRQGPVVEVDRFLPPETAARFLGPCGERTQIEQRCVGHIFLRDRTSHMRHPSTQP